MRAFLLSCAALLLHASASGQFTIWRSSPTGFEFVEGGGDSRDVLATLPTLRFQQIDATNAAALLARRVAFRRDGHLLPSAAYGARTLELEIALAEADIDGFGVDFAANVVGNRSVVLPRTRLSLPDWSASPATVPAPRDLQIPFALPWSYAGKTATGNDLLWEVRVFSNSAAGQEYPFDYDIVVPGATFGQKAPKRSGHIDLGRGCQVQLGESHLDIDIWNYGYKFTLDAHVHTAPNAPVILNVGFFDASQGFRWLCSRVHVLDGFPIPVGISSVNGDFDLDVDPIPYSASFIGIPLYFQSVAPDPSQSALGFAPVALSSGARAVVPGDPEPPIVGRVWAPDPNAQQAQFGPLPGGIIALFGTP